MTFIKKPIQYIVFLTILLVACTPAKKETPTDLEATNLSEGTMTFDVTLKDAENVPGLMKMMLPKEGKCYFSGNKMAMQVEQTMISAKVVSDGDAKLFTTDMNGDRKQVGDAEVQEKIKNSPAKLEETAETKQVLGMTATKYTLKLNTEQTPVSFYVVKDAPVGNLYWALPTGTLKGLIVEYEFKSDMGTLLLTAKSIDKTTPEAKVFE
jgi:hypothetical protein